MGTQYQNYPHIIQKCCFVYFFPPHCVDIQLGVETMEGKTQVPEYESKQGHQTLLVAVVFSIVMYSQLKVRTKTVSSI